MLGAKKILIDIKGSNTDFVKSIAASNLAMKGFAATTVASNASVVTSAAAMATGVAASGTVAVGAMGFTAAAALLQAEGLKASFLSIVAVMMGSRIKAGEATSGIIYSIKVMSTKAVMYMAVASTKIKVLITGVLGVVGVALVALGAYLLSLKKAVKAASDDQEVIIQTTALLEKQGIAWANVGEEVLNYIEDLESLTAFGDTELQKTFNAFLLIGMDVEEALQATSAAAALANGSNLDLASATKMLSNEYSDETSRLDKLNLAGESWQETLDNITNAVGDGSHVTDTLSGKLKLLGEELTDALKPSGEALLPVLMEIVDVFIWTARYAVPPLIKVIRGMLSPLVAVYKAFRLIVIGAKAAAMALKGDFTGAMDVLKGVEDVNQKLHVQLDLQEDITKEIEAQTDATDAQTAAIDSNKSALEQAYEAAKKLRESQWMLAGGYVSGTGERVTAASLGVPNIDRRQHIVEPGFDPGATRPGFDTQAVSVTINTGDINNQGDVVELANQVATAVSANRSGI